MDRVLVDAPCSGLGIIRKKPDIRYKDLAGTEALPRLQLEILNCQARYVKPGGALLYSTCTILRRENRQVVQVFLSIIRISSSSRWNCPGNSGGVCGDGDATAGEI